MKNPEFGPSPEMPSQDNNPESAESSEKTPWDVRVETAREYANADIEEIETRKRVVDEEVTMLARELERESKKRGEGESDTASESRKKYELLKAEAEELLELIHQYRSRL